MKAVVWGAGRIGRGFVAEILREGGYFIEFVDRDAALVENLNKNGRYTIFKARESGITETLIDGGFRARHTDADMDDIFLAEDLLIDVAVFKNDLESAADMIAPRLAMRAEKMPYSKADFITNVNMTSPEKAFRAMLEARLTGAAREYLDKNTGISGIFMMCISPDADAEMREKDPIAVYNNAFFEQAVDVEAFKGKKPIAPRLRLSDRLEAEEARKLYTLNMAHCACAYLGVKKGYVTSFEAISDAEIESAVNEALSEASTGLEMAFGFTENEMSDWNKIIISLLKNPYMADGLLRLGADSARKLGRDDRLATPARLCMEAGRMPRALCGIIRAGYDFDNPDNGTQKVRAIISEGGVGEAIEKISGFSKDSALYNEVIGGNKNAD